MVASLVWLVAIFSCVVFHELAHCLVGRSHGLVVHEIDLLPIGASRVSTPSPRRPRDEFSLAIAGPAASAALGLAAAALAVGLSQSLYPVDLVTGAFLPRLAWLNLLLAAFNMIPAFPLDGGRVFRSLLERRYGLARATRIAGTTGRWFAFLLIAIGMIWNLWLAIIGMFIYFGASAEETATLVHLRLAGRRVRDVMLVTPTTIDATCRCGRTASAGAPRPPRAPSPWCVPARYVGVVDLATIDRAPGSNRRRRPRGQHGRDARSGRRSRKRHPRVGRRPDARGPVVDRGRVVGLLRLDEVNQLVAGRGPGGSVAGSE